MSAKVTGGPTHWRANLDELMLGAGILREATQDTVRLATDSFVAGGVLAGVSIMTSQGPLIGVNAAQLSTGLLGLRAQVEALTTGVEYAVESYVAVETKISRAMDMARTPGAIVLSILGAAGIMDVPNDAYEIAIRGTTSAFWAPFEAAVQYLDHAVPGTKMVLGNTISWSMGLEENFWDLDPTMRTGGMLAVGLEQLGLTQLAPYDVANVTAEPGADGWQQREPLAANGSAKAMQLMKTYAYEPDTITVAKISQDDGTDAYAVMYSGTTPLDGEGGFLALLRQEAAFGSAGVVEAVAADSKYVEQATLEILAQAGVPAGATVIPMGYSQGGAHAVNMAMNESMKSRYDIPDVLTIAAPTGHRDTDDLSTNFVHVEHEHDKVTALTGAKNAARVNRTTIEVHGYPDVEVNHGVFGPEHNVEVIDRQLAKALQDPEVAQAMEIPLGSLEAKMTGAVAIQQFHLERQPATPTRHPAGQETRSAPETQYVIPVRPLQEWSSIFRKSAN